MKGPGILKFTLSFVLSLHKLRVSYFGREFVLLQFGDFLVPTSAATFAARGYNDSPSKLPLKSGELVSTYDSGVEG